MKPAVKRRRRWIWVLMLGVVLMTGAGVTWWVVSTPKPDIRKGTAFNCYTVGKCSEDCARRCPPGIKKVPCMLDCDKRCKAKGCPSGRRLSRELTDCVQSRCLWKCIRGPTPGCHNCTRTKCRAQSEACIKDRC